MIWLLTILTLFSTTATAERKVTREMLDESLRLGREFLLANQKPEGNFHYAYHILTGKPLGTDNQVRQAGVLWGLTLIHLDHPTPETEGAIARGHGFWIRHTSKEWYDGAYVRYPGFKRGHTGALSLVVLSVLDFLRSKPADDLVRERYQDLLLRYVNYLVRLQREDGLFHSSYHLATGKPESRPSPYSDGEALLALVKATKYHGFDELRANALAAAEAMWKTYYVEATRSDPDSPDTKGFFQWGIMAYHELHTSGWEGTGVYADRILELARWMIVTHRTLERKRNTAYALEGLILAWDVARRTGRWFDLARIGYVVDEGLKRLGAWQIGASGQSDMLRRLKGIQERARGGVLDSANALGLRLDVTQHQMHAVLLARKYIYLR